MSNLNEDRLSIFDWNRRNINGQRHLLRPGIGDALWRGRTIPTLRVDLDIV
jgi:hypothetical protein